MKQIGQLTVGDFMNRQPVIALPTDLLSEATAIMDDFCMSTVPVVDSDGRVCGILSNSDLVGVGREVQDDISVLTAVSQPARETLVKAMVADGDERTVADVMSEHVSTINAQANLVVAAQKLLELEYHHLPVVDADDRPIGMLSTTDFVSAVASCGSSAAG